MRLVQGLAESEARAIVEAVRRHGPFGSIEALWRASRVKVASLRALARADAFGSMGLTRQQALWHIRDLRDELLPLFDERHGGTKARRHEGENQPVPLPPIPVDRQVVYDYAATGLSLKAHPLSFIRDRLAALGVTPNVQLRDEALQPSGSLITVAGIVLVRQRPSTASGIVFATIEDETGVANLIIRPHIYDRYRKAARHAVVLIARGFVERQGEVVHIMVRSLEDAGDLLQGLDAASRDFH
jgi:error-prone DNA polymerase